MPHVGLAPDAVVIVATVRALKAHSGRHRVVAGRALPPALLEENPEEVHIGGANLRKQIENMQLFGVTPVVAINAFPGDHPSEHEAIREIAASMGVQAAVSNHFAEGGKGAIELAEAVVAAAERPSEFRLLYPDSASLREKIEIGRNARCTGPTASTTRRWRSASSTPTSGTVSASYRSASPRPTSRSPPTPA